MNIKKIPAHNHVKKREGQAFFMKIMFKSMCVGFVLTVIFSFLPFQTVCETLTQDVLRLHILANSDTNEDQELKLLVRDEITKECKELFTEAQSLEEAKEITLENLEELNKTAATVIKEQGKDYTVSVQLCEEYFNTRYYGSVTMPAGKYTALQIKIGNAKGENWWCVLYPSLCVGTSTDYESFEENLTPQECSVVSSGNKYEFKFKIVETVTSFFKFLGF